MANTQIDEGLYSRQMYVLGKDAMKKMSQSLILISGINGLGVEIAKNIILSGVKKVVLHDINTCTVKDLSSNYYISERNLNKNRASSVVRKLAELNSNVEVKSFTKPLTTKYMKHFDVIVLTDSTLEEQYKINRFTHSNNIKFINCMTLGLTGQIFTDFGNNFTVYDTDGEQPINGIISNISNDKEGLVTCIKPHKLNMSSDCYVTINEVKGMIEVNNNTYKIKYVDKESFRICCDTTKFKEYDRVSSTGIFSQVKQSKILNFKSTYLIL
jgi:ubiquitin-activating enzyme E1